MTASVSNLYAANLLFNRPIEFSKGVYIQVPTVEQAAFEPSYSLYVSCFTKMTRELFALEREVDALEERYPNLWSIMVDPEADVAIGKFFSPDKPLSGVVCDGLSYWTGLDVKGFKRLSNGKIYHENPEWLIDEVEFNRFADFIKFLTLYEKPSRLPPKINSDNRYEIWKRNYTNYLKSRAKTSGTFIDKIMILSISMDSYIPIDEIKKMSLFHFNQLSRALNMKIIYEEKAMLRASGNFKIEAKDMKHWTEQFKIQ